MAPIPRPPNLLPPQPSPLLPFELFMPPRAQAALSPSLSLPSLYRFVCISKFPLSSCLSSLFLFYTATASCLLQYAFFLPALPPSFLTTPCAAHMATHTDHSIGCTVDKSKGLAGTCHQQHHTACRHQTTPFLLLPYTGLLSRENLTWRIFRTLVWVKTLQLPKSYLVNSRKHCQGGL